MIKLLILSFLLVGCGMDVDVSDSEHRGYVSIAQAWREVCDDRFNEYDYPNLLELDQLRKECRRRFATGEETIDFPEIPEGLF